MNKDTKKAIRIFLAKVAVAAAELKIELLNHDMHAAVCVYRRTIEDLSDEILRARVNEEEVSEYVQEVLNKKAS